MTKIPEIVAPWGSYSKAIIAAKYWADAVYLWVPFTSLRMRQNKIKTFDEIEATIKDLHQMNKKAYLTMNIFPRNSDIKVFEKVVEQISWLNADAIIFSDPWTYNIIKRYLPNIPLHLSTQTSTLNYESVKFWYDLGVKRIVLARELNIKEIKEIKENIPDIELEVFGHWAMCVSYSWRCLLWEYFSGRDWNKWECSHVCRYKYKVYVEEEKRPWKFFEVKESTKWSHIFSSKDLCTIERLEEIIPYIDWLKIEWRSKSEFYVWATCLAYRHVLDSIGQWRQIDTNIKNLVYQIPHRHYREWFLLNERSNFPDWEWTEGIGYENPGPIIDKIFYWVVENISTQINWITYFKITPKQNIQVWDKLNYLKSDWKLGELSIQNMIDETKNNITNAHCNMKEIYINTNIQLEWREILYK